jgi:hypothetical protein
MLHFLDLNICEERSLKTFTKGVSSEDINASPVGDDTAIKNYFFHITMAAKKKKKATKKKATKKKRQ